MTTLFRITLASAALLASTACTTTERSLFFGSFNTVGISIGGSAAESGGAFTIGYKSQDIAMIPAYAYEGSTLVPIGAFGPGGPGVPDNVGNNNESSGIREGGVAANDSLSVFGQFSATTPVLGTSTEKVGLDKFFSTGVAAQALANGFACRLAISEVPAHITGSIDPAKCTGQSLQGKDEEQ